MCRKVSGFAFTTGLMFRTEAIRWRWQADSPEKDCLLLGAFDDPAQIPIDNNVEHVFAERELAWLHVDDGFPRAEVRPPRPCAPR